MPGSARRDPLDRLVVRLLEMQPYRFVVATPDEAAAAVAHRLRAEAVVQRGWVAPDELADGLERDEFDERAIHVVGWLDDGPVSAGRIVLPPGRLPTEVACDLIVEPVGAVVDVGRLVVARAHQDPRHRAMVALLCRLYLEVRQRGFTVACGMMSASMRGLARQLGLHLEELGPERRYWKELRAPVRFEVGRATIGLVERWGPDD